MSNPESSEKWEHVLGSAPSLLGTLDLRARLAVVVEVGWMDLRARLAAW